MAALASVSDILTKSATPIPILKKLAENHKDFIFRLEYIELCAGFRGKAVAKWQKQKVFIEDNCWDTNDESFDEAEKATHINYQKLFDMWADFDDAEAHDEVMRLISISGMGPVDAVSFAAFCYGYEQAMRKIKEAL
ncbi:hypothetical protein AGMMS49579_24200 [Spirochaetia bacterium]|nr:hypothetical protein AGMMS49579_24200 [Spirochaetia bacterium]